MPSKDDILAIWQASGLKEKLIFTCLMLVAYRTCAHIPIWGIDTNVLQHSDLSRLVGFLDMFSGGTLGKLSLVGLGIGPYITASIMMQLLAVVLPPLERLQKEEGEHGRRKISQYTRYVTLGLSIFQSLLVMKFVTSFHGFEMGLNTTWAYAVGMITLTTGAMFTMWLAEMMTQYGVGNGGSLLIFIGIVARLPMFFIQIGQAATTVTPIQSILILIMLAVFLGTIAFIVVQQEATRKVFIVSAKRQVGNKVYGGQSTYIPFKINPGGVLPIIFAFAMLTFPTTVVTMLIQRGNSNPFVLFMGKYFTSGGWLYLGTEVFLIFFFSFFYASIMPNMQPRDIADNLKKHGSAIPGIKPGRPTAEYLKNIFEKMIFIGAAFIAIIALVPLATERAIGQAIGISVFQGLGATSLIIMVGVAIDFMNQVKVNLLARQYEGFLKQ